MEHRLPGVGGIPSTTIVPDDGSGTGSPQIIHELPGVGGIPSITIVPGPKDIIHELPGVGGIPSSNIIPDDGSGTGSPQIIHRLPGVGGIPSSNLFPNIHHIYPGYDIDLNGDGILNITLFPPSGPSVIYDQTVNMGGFGILNTSVFSGEYSGSGGLPGVGMTIHSAVFSQ